MEKVSGIGNVKIDGSEFSIVPVSDLRILNEENSRLATANEDLKAENEDIEGVNNYLKKYDSDIKQINASLRSEIAELKAENERLRSDFNNLIDHMVDEIRELKEENERLKKHLKSFPKNACLIETSNVIDYICEIKELKEELVASNTENDRLKKDSESADEKLIDENDELVKKNTNLKAEIDRLRKIPTIGASEAALKEICYLKAKIYSSHMVNDHMVNDHMVNDHMVNDHMVDEIKELKAEIATLRTGFEHDIFVALEEIHSLKENNDKLKQSRKTCRDLINSYSSKLRELREEQNLLYYDIDMGSDD